jgi:hypothetical protein
MESTELARLVRAMTRQQVVTKAMQTEIGWRQAAVLLGVSERQVRRIHRRHGLEGLLDQRHLPRKKRIPAETVIGLCRLRRELYRDFSVRGTVCCSRTPRQKRCCRKPGWPSS